MSQYHDISFEEVEKIRKQVAAGEKDLIIDQTQLLLYLNQLDSKYSSQLKLLSYTSIIAFIGCFIVLFINWVLSPILFIVTILANKYSRKLANKYIWKQCAEDKVFLKFALAVGLVELA